MSHWNIGDIIDGVAKVLPPSAPALIHGSRVIPWPEFQARTNALARGLVARGHKPNDKNPRHSGEASSAPRSDAKPRPPRSNDGRANSAGASRPSESRSGAGENRGQAGENPYANGPKKNTRRPNNGASRPRHSQD